MFTFLLISVKYTWLLYYNSCIYLAQNTIYYAKWLADIHVWSNLLTVSTHFVSFWANMCFDIYTLCDRTHVTRMYIHAWSHQCVIKNEFYQLSPHQTITVNGLSTVGNGGFGERSVLVSPKTSSHINHSFSGKSWNAFETRKTPRKFAIGKIYWNCVAIKWMILAHLHAHLISSIYWNLRWMSIQFYLIENRRALITLHQFASHFTVWTLCM